MLKFLTPSVVIAALLGAVTPVFAQPLDGTEDFAQIWRRGGLEAVAGSYPTPVDGEFPALPAHPNGSASNSYPWGMGWFALPSQAPMLWVGTVRNLLCFLAPGSSEDCPEPTTDGIPLPRYPEEAAEIWRYTPNGVGGIDGTWLRAWVSPPVPFPTKCGFAVAGTGAEGFDEILAELVACAAAGGAGYPDFPQHIGIRSLEVCGANGDAANVNRLYGSNLGLPARVIQWSNAQGTFVDASFTGDTFVAEELAQLDLGLPEAELLALITDIAAELPELDLGYRTLACWDRPRQASEGEGDPVTMLCTAPAGSFEDTDSSFHPWVICNEDPSDLESPWEAQSYFGFGEPEEIGIFDLATVNTPNGEYLCASGFDRVNGGSIWCTDGTGCDVAGPGPNPEMDVQQCVWTKMISDAMGRPSSDPILGDLSGPTSNPAAFGMGTFDEDGDGFDDYLYFGMAEAAGGTNAGNALAEMGRIDFRPEIEVTGPETGPAVLAPNPNFMKWQFMAGLPRILVASGGEFVVPANMDCNAGLLFGFYQACLPETGRGLGFATSQFGFGPASYFWRFEQHEGSLYVGSLDLIGSFLGDAAGFNLWRSDDGITFQTVTNDGFGWGGTNYGVRGLLSTDPTPGVDNTPGGGFAPETEGPEPEAAIAQPVLFVGAANPYGFQSPLGGAQVWLGTTEPNFAPAAVAGPDQVVYDDEACDPVFPEACTGGDGMVMATLDGSGSYDWFAGAITGYEWFDTTGDCASLSSPVGLTDTLVPTLAAGDGVGTPYIDHTFTLRVTDDSTPTGLIGCDTVTVRASSNLPPFALFATDPPFNGSGRVHLVDFDGNGFESFGVQARCIDPEGNLAACAWDNLGSGVDLHPPRQISDPVTNPFTGTYEGTASAMAAADAQALYGDSTPELALEATDVVAVSSLSQIDVLVSPFEDTAENDTPACQSATVVTLKNVPLTFDPAAPLPGEPRFCGDPDSDPLLYESIVNVGAAQGFLDGTAALTDSDTTITYTPLLDEVGADRFTFNADDGLADPSASTTVTAGVRVIDCTLTTPVVHLVVDGEAIGSPAATREGCISVVSINGTSIVSDDATFTAGERIVLDNGFSVATGATLVLELDPSVFTE